MGEILIISPAEMLEGNQVVIPGKTLKKSRKEHRRILEKSRKKFQQSHNKYP